MKLRLTEPVQIWIEPPVDGRVHVRVIVGGELVIAGELAVDIAQPTIAEWLKLLFQQR